MCLLAVALLGHVSMAGDASAAVAALAHDLAVLTLRALLGAATTTEGCAMNFTSVSTPTAFTDVVSTAFQHATSTVCYSGIDSAGVARASLALVALARLAPLLGTNVSCPKTLSVDSASSFCANWEIGMLLVTGSFFA